MNLSERSESLRLLQGIEAGTLSTADAFNISDKIDPTLLYFVFRYLRESYPATNPSSKGVLERMVEISSTYPQLVAKAKKGEKDPIREWFDETYSIRDFRENSEEFIDLIYGKIDG
jgi:hypothetical protein